MLNDAILELSGSRLGGTVAGQDFTGQAAGTVNSTNVYDAKAQGDIGEGEDVLARLLVLTAFAGATSVEAELIGADSADLATNPVSLGSTGAVAIADLTAGKQLIIDPNPTIGSLGKRYYGIKYTFVGANATAGAIFADLGLEIQDGLKNYPSGFSIQ